MTVNTTPYPAYGGPRAAKNLRQKAGDYRGAAEELRAELDAAERAFGAAFERTDQTASTRDRIREYLVPVAQRAGVVQHMRFHDLRHTYASLMLAAGFKPYEVSRWMGHASVSTTATIYGHLYPTD